MFYLIANFACATIEQSVMNWLEKRDSAAFGALMPCACVHAAACRSCQLDALDAAESNVAM